MIWDSIIIAGELNITSECLEQTKETKKYSLLMEMILTNPWGGGLEFFTAGICGVILQREQCLGDWFCSHVNRKSIKLLLQWIVMIAEQFFCSSSCMQKTNYEMVNSFYSWDWLQFSPQPSVEAFRLHKTMNLASWQYLAFFLANGFSYTVVFLPSADRSGSHTTVWNLMCEKY